VIDAGYEVDASSAANHDAFNQCGDMHRACLSLRCDYCARRVNAARLGVILVWTGASEFPGPRFRQI
jgi:hypothetical protein